MWVGHMDIWISSPKVSKTGLRSSPSRRRARWSTKMHLRKMLQAAWLSWGKTEFLNIFTFFIKGPCHLYQAFIEAPLTTSWRNFSKIPSTACATLKYVASFSPLLNFGHVDIHSDPCFIMALAAIGHPTLCFQMFLYQCQATEFAFFILKIPYPYVRSKECLLDRPE